MLLKDIGSYTNPQKHNSTILLSTVLERYFFLSTVVLEWVYSNVGDESSTFFGNKHTAETLTLKSG